MYYFLFGEDTYSINKKIEYLKKRFLKTDPSGINVSEVDGSSINFSNYQSLILTAPFLSSKRLIFIKNVFQNSDNEIKKKIVSELKKIPESTILFFVEFVIPDQRSGLFKALNKPKVAQKFDLLTGLSFRNWVKGKLMENGASIEQEALVLFEQYLLGDLWRAESELQKLVLYKKAITENKKIEITSDDINKMVKSESQSNIFDFIDALSNKNSKKAINFFEKLINDGQNELYILTMIIYQYRNMIIISDLLSRGKSQFEIQKITKIHPFVIKKTLALIKKYNQSLLEKIYFLLQETDFGLKSGKISAEIALPRLIQKLTNFAD